MNQAPVTYGPLATALFAISVPGMIRTFRFALVAAVGAGLWLTSCGGGSPETDDAALASEDVEKALTGVDLDVRRDPG